MLVIGSAGHRTAPTKKVVTILLIIQSTLHRVYWSCSGVSMSHRRTPHAEGPHLLRCEVQFYRLKGSVVLLPSLAIYEKSFTHEECLSAVTKIKIITCCLAGKAQSRSRGMKTTPKVGHSSSTFQQLSPESHVLSLHRWKF